MLEARGLTKRYHGITAVSDVSFTIRRGEVLGYLGANGSGKSTTVRMLVQLVEPSSGSISFDGAETRLDPIAFKRRLGYVPEEPHLYPFLSGREYLEMTGDLRGLPPRLLTRRIDGFLDLFGLDGLADRAMAAYSKGTRQKILIAAALLHDPDLLVLDEPESGLDVHTGLVLRHLVQTLAARGKAILYSSHILDSVERICQRVLLLDRGRIVAEGSPSSLAGVQGHGALESVFGRLIARDPAAIATEIADVASLAG